jgi:hypothetical protein
MQRLVDMWTFCVLWRLVLENPGPYRMVLKELTKVISTQVGIVNPYIYGIDL